MGFFPEIHIVYIDKSESFVNDDRTINIKNIEKYIKNNFLGKPRNDNIIKQILDFEKIIQEYEPLFRITF